MNYQLWITDNNNKLYKYVFNNSKEAYLYYLKNYATQEDFEYYKECCNKNLYDIADDENLIASVFRNVFNLKHHLYFVTKNKNGTLIYKEIDKT